MATRVCKDGFARLAAAGSALALLAQTAPARAQPAPAPPPAPAPAVQLQAAQPPGEDSPVVEELLVVAHPPGPALWRVQKGDAQLIIVGSVTPLRHMQTWDAGRVQHALDGADLLLMPPAAKTGVRDVAGLMLGGALRLRQPMGKSLEPSLPPDLRARFVATRTRLGKDPGRYAGWKPAVAGFRLLEDFREAAGLSDAKPGSTILRMAKAKGVKVRPMAELRTSGLIGSIGKLSDGQQLECLDGALNEIDREGADPVGFGQAWAAGDLHTVRQRYGASQLERCLLQSPGVNGMVQKGVEEATGAVLKTLDRPGKTVAVIDLSFLLRRDGVLDRLKAAGATISVPPE
ncbi:TraB/GumN family protein [Caulobacter sp. CCUG 60055]|uniref:TraB/GumN family protein n=3 Tax=Pseudomonadota TaxID=1224 RepID=UPI001FA73E2B|nr:TraB/GumN family protein [Caulobacter sp. CCUG 60055]MCI3179755.1 TraB/GumN family protein [Caulobacter sp. CCUG 60055]